MSPSARRCSWRRSQPRQTGRLAVPVIQRPALVCERFWAWATRRGPREATTASADKSSRPGLLLLTKDPFVHNVCRRMELSRALVVFHDYGDHWLSQALKPGFRHVFCAINDGRYWIAVDGKMGVPEVKVVAGADYNLASFYREQGFTVLAVTPGVEPPRGPFAIANCVGMVKAALALSLPFAVTPYGLHRALQKRMARRVARRARNY